MISRRTGFMFICAVVFLTGGTYFLNFDDSLHLASESGPTEFRLIRDPNETGTVCMVAAALCALVGMAMLGLDLRKRKHRAAPSHQRELTS